MNLNTEIMGYPISATITREGYELFLMPQSGPQTDADALEHFISFFTLTLNTYRAFQGMPNPDATSIAEEQAAPDDFIAEVRRFAEMGDTADDLQPAPEQVTAPAATFTGIVSTIPPTDGYPPDPAPISTPQPRPFRTLLTAGDAIDKFETIADVVKRNNFVVLDTETTGLGDFDQIIQIGVVDSTGRTLIDSLVKATRRIDPEAEKVHGITAKHLENAPSWPDVAEQVWQAVYGKDIIIFNASFDMRLLRQTDKALSLASSDWQLLRTFCAMMPYSSAWGEWDNYRRSYRWQRLTNAIKQQRLEVPGAKAHQAIGDCLMTLELVRHMAQAASVERVED